MIKYLHSAFCLIFIFLISEISCAQKSNISPKREFRGIWVATVGNIDWPSKPGLSTEVQKQELISLLDAHQKSGINAIILQVRPAADALYGKSREPWSRVLTGKQGVAPNPFYDPLEFAVTEAHKRGMELHAWCNPYRATTNLVDSVICATHITRIHPEWFFTYGPKKYFNPGLPQVRAYITEVIMDIVKNYDIDGIHFDDYFYPYPEAKSLPDSASYALYGKNFPNIDDWRRNNVDLLIESLSKSIHAEKQYVKFGISPFGIWRNQKDDPEGSETNGLSGYSALFADARKWCKEGWIDYINPQDYFPFHYPAAPYEKLVDWWSNNSFGKNLYIGQAAYRTMEDLEGWNNKSQLPNQMRYLRENKNVNGSVFFSSKSVTNNMAGFQDSLRDEFYKYPALQPLMRWLGDKSILSPSHLKTTIENNRITLKWNAPEKESGSNPVYGYVVYRFEKRDKVNTNNSKNIVSISFDNTITSFTDLKAESGKVYRYKVTAIDRVKNESKSSGRKRVKIK
jgi:uncharacterized lipoprotein YddW (UPF0748 family)